MPRGPKPGAGVSGGAAVGRLGGRPRQSITLRLGAHVELQRRSPDGVAPLEPGSVTAIDRTGAVITLESGESIKVFL